MGNYRLSWGQSEPTILPAPSVDQASVFSSWDGPLLALGGPGTGKTTLIAQAAVREIQSGGHPVIFARTRQAASRMRNLITAGLAGQVWQPAVTTMHAFCRKIMQRFSDEPFRLLDAPEQEFRVRELLAGNPSRWPIELQKAALTSGFAKQIRQGIARARQWGLDAADVTRIGVQAGSPIWESVGAFFGEYLDVLDAEGVIDYAELVHRVRIMLYQPQISELVHAETTAVLVDDYPELDPAQVGVLAVLAPPGSKLLATGDPNTVITAFRGAYLRAVSDFAEIFPCADQSPGQVVQLNQGHRQSAAVNVAMNSLSNHFSVQRAAGKSFKSECAPAHSGGSCTAFRCENVAAQAKAIAETVRMAKISGKDYSQIGIILRSAEQAGPIRRALSAANVPIQILGSDSPLAEVPVVRVLLVALKFVAEGQVSPTQTKLLLTSELAGFDQLGLRQLLRAHQQTVGESALSRSARLTCLVNEPGWLIDADTSPAVEKLQHLFKLIEKAREQLAAGTPVDALAWSLFEGSGWSTRLIARGTTPGELSARSRMELEVLRAFFSVSGETERLGVAGVHQLIADFEARAIPADTGREAVGGRPGVSLLTVHQAKGVSWPLVLVPGAEEGNWPTQPTGFQFFDPNALDSDGLSSVTANEQLQAERRLFYTACATAAEQLVIFCSSQSGGEALEPSRFIAEMGLSVQQRPIESLPSALPDFVAALRQRAESAEKAESERKTAALILAQLANSRQRAAAPSSWWGLRSITENIINAPANCRINPSQLGNLLECPRRYFLAQEAKAEVPVSVAALLGSVIHRAIHEIQTGGLAVSAISDWLDRAFADLSYPIAWQRLHHREEAESAIRRFLLWRSSRPAEFLGSEVEFNFEYLVDAIKLQFHGSIDWLERTAAGLRVIDFKTSTTAPSGNQVAALDQLGLYQLAIDAGTLGIAEKSAGAELVYLRLEVGAGLPKVFQQPSLADVCWPAAVEPIGDRSNWIEQRLKQAAQIIKAGEFAAIANTRCRSCSFAGSCPTRQEVDV